MQRVGFEETIAELRENGVRLTPQRQWILRYLKETHSHPTAEQVHHEVSKALGGISLATVYNTLHTLTKLGVIQELSYGDGSSRFDGNESDHAHLVCDQCQTVMDIKSPMMDNLIPLEAEHAGFKIRSYRLEFYGLCEVCQKENSKEKAIINN